MPYSGDTYAAPGGTLAVTGTPISSSAYNAFVNDLVEAHNHVRPVVAGGTGAATAAAARTALFGVSTTVDNTLPRFDGVTGAIQSSTILLSDAMAMSPTVSDAAALGTGTLMWSDLFLASGGVINFNNGDVTVTHTANTLTFGGASSGYVFDAGITVTGTGAFTTVTGIGSFSGATPLTLTYTDAGAAAGPDLMMDRVSATPAVNDVLGTITGRGRDSAGNATDYAKIQFSAKVVTNTTEEGRLRYYVTLNGSDQEVSSYTANANTLTTSATDGQFLINTDKNSNSMRIMGGNATTSALLDLFGAANSSGAANDYVFRSNSTDVYRYDFSGTQHQFTGSATLSGALDIGTYGTGTMGLTFQAVGGGTIFSSRAAATSLVHATFTNSNGVVGTISTLNSGTAYNTTSDEDMKDFLGPLDPVYAINIIRSDPARRYSWKADGIMGVGWGAQTSYSVSPDLATPGSDEHPWGMDMSKRTPYLWAAVSNLLDRVEALEAA